MSDEVVRVPLGALSKDSRHALALSRPLSDHPEYRGPAIAGGAHLSPMTLAGSLSVMAVGVAALCGLFDSVGQGAIAAVLVPIIVASLVGLLTLLRTRSSQTHRSVTKLLADPSPEDSTVAVCFHTGLNMNGDRVVTAVSIPAHEHKWTLSFVAAAEITEKVRNHIASSRVVGQDTETLETEPNQDVQANLLNDLSAQAAHVATRPDCALSSTIRSHCRQLREAKSISETTDRFDPSRVCPAATAIRLVHNQAVEALKVYTHLPESAVHLRLTSGRTPTQELVETLETLATEATSVAADAVQTHANKLSQLRRYSNDKYYRSELDH